MRLWGLRLVAPDGRLHIVHRDDRSFFGRLRGVVPYPPERFFSIDGGKLIGRGVGVKDINVAPTGGWAGGTLIGRLADGRLLLSTLMILLTMLGYGR